MTFLRSLAVITLFAASLPLCFGQERVEDEDWLSEATGMYKQPFLSYRFGRYTADDVALAKEKLSLLQASKTTDEWAGIYVTSAPLSDTKLIWRPDAGFLDYYIYTCSIELRALNYGKVINYPDHVLFISEKASNSPLKPGEIVQFKLIKVKWGDRHYLVEESELETFCELAAGYHGPAKIEKGKLANGEPYESYTTIWMYYWVLMDDELTKEVFGIPVLPAAYAKKYSRPPIETRIVSIGKYKKTAREDGQGFDTNQFVTIGLGTSGGVKKGMQFYVPQLEDRITVVKAFGKSSIALLERSVDSETGKETCYDEEGESPCTPIQAGMEIKTVPEEFLTQIREKNRVDN